MRSGTLRAVVCRTVHLSPGKVGIAAKEVVGGALKKLMSGSVLLRLNSGVGRQRRAV